MPTEQQRVLIVDDSRFVRTTFKTLLSGAFTVREEADGEAAWEAIQGDPSIVMVFSDLDMPKLDGYALIERVRASEDERIRGLPLVVISGSQDEGSDRRAREVGANEFISKSAEAPEVLARIEKLLQKFGRRAPAAPALVVEGRKRYEQARHHGRKLSVMALRVESYEEVAKALGPQLSSQLLGRIERVIAGALRPDDLVGRRAAATFLVVSCGIDATQASAVARRLCEQLEHAQLRYGARTLAIRASFGVASLEIDASKSIDELIALALQRLHAPPSALPDELERALRVIERIDAERLGERAKEVGLRLLKVAKALGGK